MRKLLFLILLFVGCTKQQAKLDTFSTENSITTLLGGFVCTCNEGDYYRGIISLSNTASSGTPYLVYSKDKLKVTRYKALVKVDGKQKFKISHIGYSCGIGGLYVVSVLPVKGQPIPIETAHNTLETACVGCYNCPL